MPNWKSRICDAWRDAVPPANPILKEEAPPGWSDAADAERWLAGEKWDDIASDHDRLDVEMPFFYLNDPACAYYLGGYLLHLAEAFDDEYISCLAPVHFTSLMGHARFSSIIQQLSREQQLVLGEFSTAMLENSDLFWLDEALSAKLREGVTLLTGA